MIESRNESRRLESGNCVLALLSSRGGGREKKFEGADREGLLLVAGRR